MGTPGGSTGTWWCGNIEVAGSAGCQGGRMGNKLWLSRVWRLALGAETIHWFNWKASLACLAWSMHHAASSHAAGSVPLGYSTSRVISSTEAPSEFNNNGVRVCVSGLTEWVYCEFHVIQRRTILWLCWGSTVPPRVAWRRITDNVDEIETQWFEMNKQMYLRVTRTRGKETK